MLIIELNVVVVLIVVLLLLVVVLVGSLLCIGRRKNETKNPVCSVLTVDDWPL